MGVDAEALRHNEADLRATLTTTVVGRDVRCFEEIDSTSTEARRVVESGAGVHGAAIVAHRQSAGRGTSGKAWDSKTPVGLWVTVILVDAAPQPISLMIGCAVVDAIRAVAGGAVDAHLKWPNDVLIGSGVGGVGGARKVSGILVETAFAPGVKAPAHLVGIGINVHQEAFDGELAGRATSLRMTLGDAWDGSITVPRVFGALMGAIERHLSAPETIADRWVVRTRMIDSPAEVVRGGYRTPVMVRGITSDGRLVVDRSGKWKVESGNQEGWGGTRVTLAAASDMDLVWPVE